MVVGAAPQAAWLALAVMAMETVTTTTACSWIGTACQLADA